MIQIEHASKTFTAARRSVHALKDVSLHVEKGEIFGVIGYSGAGKSTLIRLVNALEKPESGSVRIDGADITKRTKKELNSLRKEIGMIFQQFNLLESQTVYQNIALPLILAKVNKGTIRKRVQELLSFVELEDKKEVYVSQLSGGQKQRIGIARALATNPKILLCDEATSALDPQTTESILQLLQKINRELGITILLITHEMTVIQKICHKVAIMKQGEICEQGPTTVVFSKPQQEITRSFVSTVINDTIPQSLLSHLSRRDPIIKITFFGDNSREALISQINKQFDIDTTILFASVNELPGAVLGILILQLKGSAEEIAKAEAYIRKQQFEMERVVIPHD